MQYWHIDQCMTNCCVNMVRIMRPARLLLVHWLSFTVSGTTQQSGIIDVTRGWAFSVIRWFPHASDVAERRMGTSQDRERDENNQFVVVVDFSVCLWAVLGIAHTVSSAWVIRAVERESLNRGIGFSPSLCVDEWVTNLAEASTAHVVLEGKNH